MNETKKEQQKRAMKAYHLRKRKKEGKYVSPAEETWLAEYERIVNERKAALPSLPQLPASASSVDDAKLPPIDVPLPDGEEPTPEPAPSDVTSEPIEPEIVDEKKEQEQASEEAKRAGSSAADKYCEWIKQLGKDCEAMGGMAMPVELVDTLIHYAAEGTFTRLMQSMGGEMSERAQDLTVLVSGASMYAQRFLLRKKQETKAQSPAPSRRTVVTENPTAEKTDDKLPLFGSGMLNKVF